VSVTVGREAELAQRRVAWRRNAPILTIVGEAGIGTTPRALADRSPDGWRVLTACTAAEAALAL
jgi:hypothetical protein